MKKLLGSLALLLLASPVLATCGGGGGGGVGGVAPRMSGGRFDDVEVYRVPWRVVRPGDPAPESALTLYWFALTREEQRASELLASRPLTLAAGRCIFLAAVSPEDDLRRQKLNVPVKTSAVLLVAADGTELGRVLPKSGPAGRDEVEKLIKESLDKREKSVDAQLDAARAKEDGGDKDAAIALYQQVWGERCLAQKPAKKAAKALKKLGKPVADEMSLAAPLPDLTPSTGTRIAHALAEGLRAENDLRIADAQKAYEAARQIDPADPVPLRFLGELYRHHTGEWAKARKTFDDLLALADADPLSRAVALHGLGKMTIHEGDFAKGLGLFERSVATYPLPLTYRNLAVYWSSEGKADKAYGYVEQAMALEPDEEYNQIFAATFLVKLGKPEEAARIAQAHEALLAASYNLAAIWAQLGERDKALALLKRHFYTYERFEAVRRKEMEEARVDIVFASLKKDPAFVDLTALADRMLSR
jgi:tetratricopeptide (TPR) repeat protein